MIYLALGLLLLGAVYGGRRGAALDRLMAGARGALGLWRPTAGLTSLLLTVLTLVLVVRDDWIVAAPVGLAALVLALGARWRTSRPRSRSREARPADAMSVSQARAILGVGPEANAAEIQAAYRRLIRAVHPDSGGTRGLAAQLNLARDVLRRSAAA